MKAILFFSKLITVGLFFLSYQAQSIDKASMKKFPFNDSFWQIENTEGTFDSLEILEHQGRQSLLVKAGQQAILKDVMLENFVVDFYTNGQVPGLAFRVQDLENYEYLYLRMMMSGKHDALQYVPIHNGNLPWQLYNYPKYEGSAIYPRKKVLSLPITMKKLLVKGKVSDSLFLALEEKGHTFSNESFLDIPEGSPAYIFDPKSNRALIFEIKEDAIEFLDFKVWVHLRVKVVENSMSVYVGDMNTPTFVVENLKRDIQAGGISIFSNFGDFYLSNFFIKEIKSIHSNSAEITPKPTPPKYLSQWQMSETFTKEPERLLQQVDSLIANEEQFKVIEADEDGLINVSRFYHDMEKTVLFGSTLISDEDKEVTLNFDFADQLVILLNSQILYEGEMNFRPPPNKGTEGRVFVQDEEIKLDLKQGKNRLYFVLSGDSRQKFNWGFIAKLNQSNGITIE